MEGGSVSESLTLYQRSAALVALDALIGDNDGEITPEMEAQADALTASFTEKVDACLAKRQEFQALSDLCANEARRYAQRAKALQDRANWLDRYVVRCMEQAGRDVVEGERFRVKLTPNPPKVAGILIDPPAMRSDFDRLPPALREAVKVTPAAPESYAWDKAALLKLAKTDPAALDGVALIDTTGKRLTIT